MNIAVIATASLDDPLYYLRNARQVITLCLNQYADLLLSDEIQQLEDLLALEEPTQALLIRMVMRKGSLFRQDNLNYSEVPERDAAIRQLVATGLVDDKPALSIQALGDVCRREECRLLANQLLPEHTLAASCRKSDALGRLLEHFADEAPKRLRDWWPDAPFDVLEIRCTTLFDRLRLMFFGNLYQSWSEFVLTELGLQRFEPVSLTPASRPFQRRAEVDLYLALQQLRDRVALGESIEEVCQALPAPIECDWINYRRQKVLFQIGREAERQQQIEQALNLYRQSQHREAQLRTLRLLEKREPAEHVFTLATKAYEQISQPEIRIGLQRILKRSARKAGLDYLAPKPFEVPLDTLTLVKPAFHRVESAVIEALSDTDTRLFHVENHLFTGLFALLFWPALYAPVRGAFFNPFQPGPADLFRPGFADARTMWIEAGFDQLRTGRYQATILERLEQKRGISCSLIYWPSLTFELVKSALDIIPAAHLEAVFRHLLLDLRHHRRGLPDLIALNHNAARYRLIEVKGPGDRLQDSQRLWMQAMLAHSMPVSVLHVRWSEANS
ncbi:VRR-NUC domain-containing protein [Halomonas vilamensis]|uniref:phosphodiesterase I n=1 Tax=Vreelandella vilamensis TaxID=531309 RepID=A0ABU1H2F3_9GAMM|nr:VRR-NUC domain-containing protein [Halomonas vilamensis]MDR5898478.1 VRR-NUC domain-containing protein [Halomonas vilamensis]